ncbi:hypothetical protein GOP47_0007258 [Adiantum capillus-veneris]|uniref:C2 NT-type domain-containing protein n=1 Tax=Adiantum capillus-veneris TaxID=13818 RepID=A0A9D4V0M6_ADICA|nr:hypothetical protein GOP47_0007258 [Adiantum capillus-veneris]
MVVNMMKWRPWLTTPTRCFQVKLKLHCLEGLSALLAAKSGDLGTVSSPSKSSGELNTMMVNVKWKGPRRALGSRFKRSLKRAKTTARFLEDSPLVTWNEEFEHTCILTLTKDGQFLPWDICFVVNQVNTKSKSIVLGTAWMNVAKFVPMIGNMKQTAKIHVLTSSGMRSPASLVVTADFVELRTSESAGFDHPVLSCIGGPLLCTVDAQLVEAAADEKQKVAKSSPSSEGNDSVSFPKLESTSDSSRDSVDSDSTVEWDGEEGIDPQELYVNGYGPLMGVNLVVEGALSHCKESFQVLDDHVSSISESPNAGDRVPDPDQSGTVLSAAEVALTSSSMRNILGWRKRKLKFRLSRWRGEPLLNKEYGEDGGDDIDFDRRFTSVPAKTPESQTDGSSSTTPECLDFGDEHFAIGSWERREFVSRDGQMKLEGDVFFATIDQRSERAAGESACTALVAVISAWLHQNPGRMPIKAELDTLIREGSADWRELCNRAAYEDLFPDGHFDFETVINAKVRPLEELPEKSYIGFFQLNSLEDGCDYLQGAMSFDSIWEEIITKKEAHAAIYAVSWNDHFFILKVEDKETRLFLNPSVETEKEELANSLSSLDEKSTREAKQLDANDPLDSKVSANEGLKEADGRLLSPRSEIFYSGKEACKEFIKGFFAALPLRELERDIRKGLHGHILHQRLQIEFHYTSLVERQAVSSCDS